MASVAEVAAVAVAAVLCTPCLRAHNTRPSSARTNQLANSQSRRCNRTVAVASVAEAAVALAAASAVAQAAVAVWVAADNPSSDSDSTNPSWQWTTLPANLKALHCNHMARSWSKLWLSWLA